MILPDQLAHQPMAEILKVVELSRGRVVDLGRLSYVDVLVWTPQTPGATSGVGSDTGGVSSAGTATTTTAPGPTTTKAAP